MLYFFIVSNDSVIKNLEVIIEKIYFIFICLVDLDVDIVIKFKDNELYENVCMWGVIFGFLNVDRWEKLKEGDRILVYFKGEFKFFGIIFVKIYNLDVVRKI